MAEALDKAAAPGVDNGELSWGVLAHLIRETRFVLVWRRLKFMKEMWGVPVDEYWNQVRSDVAAHRYLPFLETYALPPRESWPKFLAFIDRVELTDLQKNAEDMNLLFWRSRSPRGRLATEMAWAHSDLTARERSLAQSNEDAKYHATASREILMVSPFNPYARATLIDYEWDKVKANVKTWEKEAGDDPVVLGSIGWHFLEEKQYEEARAALTRYVELSPDLWAYRKIAETYKSEGKIDRWQETLDDFLNKVEDLGLDHANVRIEVAEYLMDLKQWDKAMPYAEDAAQSWSELSMLCAARCAEGIKDWDRAEAWHRRITERYYEYSWHDWYHFCKRTGHGDLKAARTFVDAVIAMKANRRDPISEEDLGGFYWLDGRTDQAKAVLSRAYSDRGSFFAACCLAMIADDAKDVGRRDEIIKGLITKYKKGDPQMMETFQMLLDTVLDPVGKKPIDPAALNRLIEKTRGSRGLRQLLRRMVPQESWPGRRREETARARREFTGPLDPVPCPRRRCDQAPVVEMIEPSTEDRVTASEWTSGGAGNLTRRLPRSGPTSTSRALTARGQRT